MDGTGREQSLGDEQSRLIFMANWRTISTMMVATSAPA